MGTQRCVNRKWIVESFAIVNGGSLDLIDGRIDLAYRFLIVVFDWAPRPVIVQVMPGCAQISECMQVGGMRSWDLLCLCGVGRSQRYDTES
jgi:hypothetical protein